LRTRPTTIVTKTRRRPADDRSTAFERNRAEDARLVQRVDVATAELHGVWSAGWQDVVSFNGASFSSEFGRPRAHKAQAGLHLIEAIHDYIYELHEFDEFGLRP
jgi:hypothetical protein